MFAFVAHTTTPQVESGQTVPFSTPGAGSATTDRSGGFRITGLKVSGEYMVIAKPRTLTSGARTQATVYATTFYPSTIDPQAAVAVSARSDDTAIEMRLVAVPGARVSGSVTSAASRSLVGMQVHLFERLGGFGSENVVGAVNADGTFEIVRVPPGWYRLTIGQRPSSPGIRNGEFATALVEVRNQDINGLALVTDPGALLTGRVVPEPGAGIQQTGLLITASLRDDYYGISGLLTSNVDDDWSFRIAGLSGAYELFARADRPPFVSAASVTIDGIEGPVNAVELTGGSHDVILFVAPRTTPAPGVSVVLSSNAADQFKNEKLSFRQFDIAKAIVERRDASVLAPLADWLTHEDRHIRGNVAFIFAALGDSRGFPTIAGILSDRSDRREGQGGSRGRFSVAQQIRADRYYAVHLLGQLRDPQAVPILLTLLKDSDVNSNVAWALGQIGDARAIGPLLDRLKEDDPSVRVLTIYALEELNAREAVPRLTDLLEDRRRSNFGAAVSVAEAARAAIATLTR